MSELKLRAETVADRGRIATLIAKTYLIDGVRAIEKAGCLRLLPEYNSELAMVAEASENDNKVVAFALFTPVKITGKNMENVKAVVLDPLAFDASEKALDVVSFFKQTEERLVGLGVENVFLFNETGELSELGYHPVDELALSYEGGEKNSILWVKKIQNTSNEAVLNGTVYIPDINI